MKLFRRKQKESRLKGGDQLSVSVFGSGLAQGANPFYNSALWACIMNLARQYATLPLHPYSKGSHNERVALPDTSLLVQLMKNPNPMQTGYDFRFQMGINFELHGQAVAIIERSKVTGKPKNLYPISPSCIIKSVDESGKVFYKIIPSGKRYERDEVLEINNTTESMVSVLSPMKFASDLITLEQTVKQMQKDYYSGNSIIGNVIKVPSNFNQEQMDILKASFDSAKGYKNFVVKDGVTITPLQVASGDVKTLVDAQAWSTKEIARRWQVPPFMIGDTSVTYGSAEQQGLNMVQYCLGPRVAAWEIALTSALCPPGKYFKFTLEGLMRGDHQTRAAFYHAAIMDGWMSINEVREKEELPPIKDGDTHFFPLNYGPLDKVAAGAYANNGMEWSEEGLPHTQNQELTESERLAEKKRKDLLFIEKAQRPVKASRKKLEKMIKAQLKKEIEKFRELIATGQPANQVLVDFSDWLNTEAKDLAPQFKDVYLDVLRRMLPSVQDQTNIHDPVEDSSMDAFASEYAKGMAARHTGYVYSRVKSSIETDTFDDAMENMQNDYPAIESEEEVQRSSNACAVFLYSALGVTYMHSVARPDACAFCSKLDGKICAVNGYILQKGTDEDDGEGNVRHIQKNYKHPPYHSHCSCFMAPGQ